MQSCGGQLPAGAENNTDKSSEAQPQRWRHRNTKQWADIQEQHILTPDCANADALTQKCCMCGGHRVNMGSLHGYRLFSKYQNLGLLAFYVSLKKKR